jgi:hypothetical protein
MLCPRCTTATLVERERDGTLVDACPDCRGVWLDRGELEKLIARAAREIEDMEGARRDRDLRPARRDDDRYRDEHRPRDESRYREDDRDKYGPRRKKSLLESLGDIFD